LIALTRADRGLPLTRKTRSPLLRQRPTQVEEITMSPILSRVANVAIGTCSVVLLASTLQPALASTMSAPTSLSQAAMQGEHIFNHDKFGGVQTCSACHVNGGTTMGHLPNGTKIPSLMGVAAQFPRYNPAAHSVVTLQQQLAHCITGGLKGKPPSPNSTQMTDLVTYLTKLSKGAVMGQQFK
jgi:thiosulfate dehydrogenase